MFSIPRISAAGHMLNTLDLKVAAMRRSVWQRATLRRFERNHGFVPDLTRPHRFSEKLIKRILEDEDPYYPMYGTKLFAPLYLAALGIPGLSLPKRLKVCPRLNPEDFEDLPESFIMKSNFGSGLNLLVRDKADIDLHDVCDRFNAALPAIKNAQGRRSAENCVVFEGLLGDPSGPLPVDYQLECFHRRDGSSRIFLRVLTKTDTARFDTYYDEDLRPIEVNMAHRVAHPEVPVLPNNVEDMIEIARRASQGFDYIRVDLFNVDGTIVFGELTPFHSGGLRPYTSQAWDTKLGAIWDQRFPTFNPDEVPGFGDMPLTSSPATCGGLHGNQ